MRPRVRQVGPAAFVLIALAGAGPLPGERVGPLAGNAAPTPAALSEPVTGRGGDVDVPPGHDERAREPKDHVPYGQAKRADSAPAAAPAPEPVAEASARPDAPAPAPAPAAPAPAPAPAPPAPAPAPAAPAASQARPTVLSRRPQAPSRSRPEASSRMPLAPAAPAVGAPRRLISAPAASPAAPPARRGQPRLTEAPTAARAPRAQPDDDADPPLTRTVVRILELVPQRLVLALAALGLLGLVLAAAALVQTRRARRLERVRRRLAADVGLLQSVLLPVLPARIGRAAVSAAYRPAEGLAAGGDFYDAFELADGRTAVIIGDVTGHGREVVPLTALVRYTLRAYLEAGLAPRAALAVAADAVAGELDERQVTVGVAVLDGATGRLTYACAGHWPPLVRGLPGALVTTCSSPPLGTALPTGRRETTLTLPPGAVACFYTDGLSDVVCGRGRLGPDGLMEVLEGLGEQPTASEVVSAVTACSAEQPDDIAVCLLAPDVDVPLAAPRIEELEVDSLTLSGARRFLAACGVSDAEAARAVSAAALLVEREGSALLRVKVADDADAAVLPADAAQPAMLVAAG